MDLWCRLLCLLEDSKSACFRDPRKHHILVEGETVAAGDVGKALTSPAGARDGKEGPCASGAAAGVPAPAVEEDRARSAQARRAGTVPAAPSSAAGAPARARIRPVGWAGSPILFPPRGWGNGAVALTWLVRGGLDGHGSGARGGTGSPEKDRLFGRGAGESGRQAALSTVSEAAPWTPTRSFSAAARPPSHYPPPSSAAAAAAASTSSSAETPRPLHTLSHHAAGEPLPPTRHFRAQVARSGPGAGECWGGGGEDTLGESVSQHAYPCAGAVAQSAGRHFGCGQAALFLDFLRVIEL
ncbi:uncharacterized protein [Pseudorca crassidens]|uniref:uncharacterized protein n=1 Tax=Pseudorca crassidens TaxID=82174 RepID=UPI00352E3BAE